MASTIVLKRRIGSIKNTRQITKAMELVSASKLRRAQEYAQRSRDYSDLATTMLNRLAAMTEVSRQPLFEERPIKARLYIVVTSNSGLAGAYNANVLKLLAKGLQEDRAAKIHSQVITIGSKGAQFVRRISDVKLVAVYPALGDRPTANDLRPVLNTMIRSYEDKTVDNVQLIYTVYKSAVIQQATVKTMLPELAPKEASSESYLSNFEPDVETVIEQVTTRLLEAQLWQSVLEGLASEHAMRMVAMKNATDNAKDLIDDYTLELNTARQAGITQELAEITGGAEAMK